MSIHSQQLKKLTQYSAASLAFLSAGQTVSGQIIITDVEPDIFIDAPNSFYELDLDNNGLTDFFISATSVSFLSTTAEGVFNNFIRGVNADPGSGNFIAGYTAADGFAYPFALNVSDVIDSITPMQSDAFQSMAYSFYAVKNASTVFNIISAGEWLNGETDKFLGFKFLIESEYHFGWARLDVGVDNNAFTIKSYAYEASANTGIETTLDVVPVNTVESAQLSMYSYNNVLHVQTGSPNFQNQLLTIYAVNGNCVLSHNSDAVAYTIDVNFLPSGIYFVQIISNGQVFSKKIVID